MSLVPLTDVPSAALPDLCAQAVSAAERSERSLHWGNQLLQPHPHGHQLPTGTDTDTDMHTHTQKRKIFCNKSSM